MMRGVFMDKIIDLNKIRRRQSPVRVIVIVLLAVAALVVGLYFVFNASQKNGTSKGTYVFRYQEKGSLITESQKFGHLLTDAMRKDVTE